MSTQPPGRSTITDQLLRLQQAIRDSAEATRETLQSIAAWEKTSGIHERDQEYSKLAAKYRPLVRAGRLAPTMAFGQIESGGKQQKQEESRGIVEVEDEKAQTDQERAEAASAQGASEYGRGNYVSAVQYFTSAMSISPGMAKYRLNRALANMKLGNWQSVVEDTTGALACDITALSKAKALLRRAHALAELHNFDEADWDLNDAYQILPVDLQQQVESERKHLRELMSSVISTNQPSIEQQKEDDTITTPGDAQNSASQPDSRKVVVMEEENTLEDQHDEKADATQDWSGVSVPQSVLQRYKRPGKSTRQRAMAAIRQIQRENMENTPQTTES